MIERAKQTAVTCGVAVLGLLAGAALVAALIGLALLDLASAARKRISKASVAGNG